MANLGDVGRQVQPEVVYIALTLPGALGMGNKDISREIPPIGGGGSGTGVGVMTGSVT